MQVVKSQVLQIVIHSYVPWMMALVANDSG